MLRFTLVIHFTCTGVMLHIPGEFETKHYHRDQIETVGEQVAAKLGGSLLYWKEEDV